MIFKKIEKTAKRKFNKYSEIIANYKKERQIRTALRKLSKQRVKANFGNTWEIENIIPDDNNTKLALDTCLMRGWVEEIPEPHGQISYPPPPPPVPPGEKPYRHHPTIRIGPYYRPTEIGWAIVNRSHQFNMLALLLTGLGVLGTVIMPIVLSSPNQTGVATVTTAPGSLMHLYQPQDPEFWPPLRQPSAALRWPVQTP